MPSDDCEICRGRKGGVKGNENVVEGVVICDYCWCDLCNNRQSEDELLTWERLRNGPS